MTRWSDLLEQECTVAAEEALQVLADRGFVEEAPGTWTGKLELRDSTVDVRVSLPGGFPDKLPEVFLVDPSSVEVRSHIERDGKICLATTSGILLDTERPSALVVDSLDRAISVLGATREEQDTDVELEFIAYWPEENADAAIWSLVNPDTAGREIVYATIKLNSTHLLFAETEDTLKKWASRTQASRGEIKKSYFAKLQSLPESPRFDESVSTRELDELFKNHMSQEEYTKWRGWDGKRRPPGAMLIACELADDSHVVFATRSAILNDSQKQAIENPYSRKPPPVKKIRNALENNAVGRRSVTRLDVPHLLNRTGGAIGLHDARVAIIGCGAIGSQIAVSAAAAGVAELQLVDNELLNAENIHRHVLGVRDLRKPKAIALSDHIHGRFAHANVTPRTEKIETELDKSPGLFEDTDLVIVALGDETLERRLNQYFGNSVMRLHAWIEPLGIGGHCLVVPGNSQKGCYECLYARDSDHVLYNMSSLCERGQVFQKTTGGCAGTFTPFGYSDTLDVALRVSRVMSRVLNDATVNQSLLSWIGDERLFLESGYRLSRRGNSLVDARESYSKDIARADCKVCSKW